MSSRPTPRDFDIAEADPLFASASAAEKYRLAQAVQLVRLIARRAPPSRGRAAEVALDLRALRFAGRGLSGRSIAAMTKAGIDLPERTLFMSQTQIRAIPGLGKMGLAELIAYRARFMVA